MKIFHFTITILSDVKMSKHFEFFFKKKGKEKNRNSVLCSQQEMEVSEWKLTKHFFQLQ